MRVAPVIVVVVIVVVVGGGGMDMDADGADGSNGAEAVAAAAVAPVILVTRPADAATSVDFTTLDEMVVMSDPPEEGLTPTPNEDDPFAPVPAPAPEPAPNPSAMGFLTESGTAKHMGAPPMTFPSAPMLVTRLAMDGPLGSTAL